MKKKSFTQAAIFSPRAVIALVSFIAAVFVVLLSEANSKNLLADHMRQPIKPLPRPPAGAQEAWVARYDGPATNDDEATAVAIDGSGNIYVTGFSFDPTTVYDYATIKYNSAGQQQWIARYDGPENYTDQATAITVDASGNVYVTGGSSSNSGSLDYTTIKYNSAGQQQWVARYDGFGDDDVATAIAVDGSGNVYVTGYSYGSGFNYDYVTIKYNSTGQQQWVARYDGPGNDDDKAIAIAVDASGSVYITGRSYDPASDYDYATIRYDSAGQQQWVARYNGPANSDDEARAMAIDGAGNIYVTGYSGGSASNDYATIKYDSAGQQQWVGRYDGPGHSDDTANAISIDGSGFVYVTGYSAGSAGSYDYATIKYDASGEQQWATRYDGPTNSEDLATAITVDDFGSVYVTGTTDADPSFWSGGDYTTIKYDSAGRQQWIEHYGGPGSYTDWPTAIVLDASDDVIVTGYSYGTDFDYATIKYVQGATPTPTPTSTPTASPTATPTASPTATPSATPRVIPRPRPTPHPRPTPL